MLAHDMLIKAMDHGGHLCVMASEEEEDIIQIPQKFNIGKYVLLFDPLDGSSNIDANISIGTIFSIYRRVSPDNGPGTMEDCFTARHSSGCSRLRYLWFKYDACYTAGSGVTDLLSILHSVNFFFRIQTSRLRRNQKSTALTKATIFTGTRLKKYIKYLQEEDKATNRPYSSRYIVRWSQIFTAIFYTVEYLCIPLIQEILMVNYDCNMSATQCIYC